MLEKMKKIVCMIFAITMFFSAVAQEHLTFLGVPIDGTLQQFTNRITDKGCVFIQEAGGVNMFFGSYGGYDNCVIGVVPLENKDLVYSVLVCIIGFDDWSTLNKAYSDIKNKLTKEYGKPKEEHNEFSTTVNSDPEKFKAVTAGQCNYTTSFVTKLGNVDLSFENIQDLGPSVVIQFTDNVN